MDRKSQWQVTCVFFLILFFFALGADKWVLWEGFAGVHATCKATLRDCYINCAVNDFTVVLESKIAYSSLCDCDLKHILCNNLSNMVLSAKTKKC